MCSLPEDQDAFTLAFLEAFRAQKRPVLQQQARRRQQQAEQQVMDRVALEAQRQRTGPVQAQGLRQGELAGRNGAQQQPTPGPLGRQGQRHVQQQQTEAAAAAGGGAATRGAAETSPGTERGKKRGREVSPGANEERGKLIWWGACWECCVVNINLQLAVRYVLLKWLG